MKVQLLHISVWLLYILADALYNWYIIEKKNTVPHYLPMTIFRGMMAIFYGAFIDTNTDTVLYWLIFTTCSFWLVFDVSLNLMRGKSPFYIGTNSTIDRFGLKFPVTYWLLKIACLVLLVIIL